MSRVPQCLACAAEHMPMAIYDAQLDIRRLTDGLSYSGCDPLIDAYLACLEAANSISLAVERRTEDPQAAPDGALQEALFAARAAAAAIKFSLVQQSDSARESPAAE
jgi:hypothetical protein